MSNNRLLYIDFLKGIAIFLMVMGHFLYGLHMPNNNGQYIIAQIIYTFHMPLFMFVSGYVFDLNNKYKWNFIELREVMWKKMLTLLLPGFVLGLFVSYILGKGICFPWFLRALFEISITFFCLKILFRKVDKIYVDFVILIVGYCLLFLFGRLCKGSALDTFLGIPYWQIFYPYFVIGFLFRKYNMYKLIAKYHLYSVSLILFIAFFYFEKNINRFHVLIAFKTYMQAVSGIIILYWFSRKLNYDNDWNTLICKLGGASLAIYLLHDYYLPHFPFIANWIMDVSSLNTATIAESIAIQLVSSIFFSGYSVVLSWITMKFILNSKFLSFICLGKYEKYC